MSACPRCGYSNDVKSFVPTSTTRGSNTKRILIGVAAVVGVTVIIFTMLPVSQIFSIFERNAPDSSSAPEQSPPEDDKPIIELPTLFEEPTIEELRAYTLEKVNKDRAGFGLAPVALSDNQAAQVHAEDVFETQAISHWMTNGEKPYMTYTRLGGLGDVGQNVAVQGYSKSDADACKFGLASCTWTNPFDAITEAEYGMMYEDLECCDNGHRDNILDKYHTHVSFGIAYDRYYFAFVQNFENHYVNWSQPISYNENSKEVTMTGRFNDGLREGGIQIYYDPLPTNEVYLQNRDRGSYDSGELIAGVLPQGWHLGDSSLLAIYASKWDVNSGNFDISFSLEEAIAKHGNGVYTIVLWTDNETGDAFTVSNASIIVR